MSYVLEGQKWFSGPITWSFAAFNYAADSAIAFSSLMSSAYQAVVDRAVQAWSSISGVTFQQVADSPNPATAADIRIGFGIFNTQTTGVVGLTKYFFSGQSFNKDVVVRLEDPGQVPIIDANGILTYQGYLSTVYQVAVHELGHALGLGHSPDPSLVMYPVAGSQNRDIGPSDIAGIQALYGPAPVTANPTPITIGAAILLQNDNGSVAIWQMNGTTIVNGGPISLNLGTNWSAEAIGDFSGGGGTDILWQNMDGTVAIWQMAGTSIIGADTVGPSPGAAWHVAAAADMNGDGRTDILFQNTDGSVAIWNMNGTAIVGGGVVGFNPGPAWQIKGTGDFLGNRHTDILWQNLDGSVAIWDMNGTTIVGGGVVGINPGPAWQVKGTGDFFGDHHTDILWQNVDGSVAIWDMNGTAIIAGGVIGLNPGPSWHVKTASAYFGAGKTDILWQNDSGATAIWHMNGTSIAGGGVIDANLGAGWHAVGTDKMHFIDGTSDTAAVAATAQPDAFVLTDLMPGVHSLAGFDPGQDIIELSQSRFASFGDVEAASRASGDGTLITLAPSSSLLIQGIAPESLHANNFVAV